MRLRGRILFYGKPPRLAAIPGLFRTFAAETRYGMKDQRHNARLFEEHGRQRAPDGTARGGRLRSPFRQRPHGRQGRGHQHLRVHRRRQTGVCRHDPARGGREKNAGKIERLFVIGCLSERYADSLRAELPEVDGFFGAPHMGRHRPGAGSRRRPGPGH